MMIRALPVIAACVLAAALLPQGHAADAPRELHGSADAVAEPGMALAWSVLRGANEDATLVVVRIVTDPSVYSHVAVTGVDPFTQQQWAMLPRTASTGVIDVQMPRAHFAAFPRTELRFFPQESTPANATAALLVFYLGVPDTTPEFVDDAKLATYLRERIIQVRRGAPP